MAAQIARFGRALAAWEPDLAMPVVYLWVFVAGTFTWTHFITRMPGTSLDSAPINTTDINIVIDQLHDERHKLFSTRADIRPDILGRIYYDSAINKRLPETRAECDALSQVLHSSFTSPNGTDWISLLYEGHDALACGTWYDETGWTPRRHPWPFIIDYWLQWDDHRFGEASGCERPHSRCYNSDKFLKTPLEESSEAVTTSSVIRTQATETTTTTMTVTASQWDGHVRISGKSECRQRLQPFPIHPTRTTTECVIVTTTTTMPVTSYLVETVLETHYVSGTPPTVFSRNIPTTIDGESYLCEWPSCSTSTAIQWKSATITVTREPDPSPSTVLDAEDEDSDTEDEASDTEDEASDTEDEASDAGDEILDAENKDAENKVVEDKVAEDKVMKDNVAKDKVIKDKVAKGKVAKEKVANAVTSGPSTIGRYWESTKKTPPSILKWLLADPKDAVEYKDDKWYHIARYWVLRSLRYLVHLPVLLPLQSVCAYMSVFGSCWRIMLTTFEIVGLVLYRPLQIIGLIVFNAAGSRDPVSLVKSIETYRDSLGIIDGFLNFFMTVLHWFHDRRIDLESGCGGARDSLCRFTYLQHMSDSLRNLTREKLWVVYGFFQRTSAGLVLSAEYYTSKFTISQKATELQFRIVELLNSGYEYLARSTSTHFWEKYLLGGDDSPSAVSPSNRFFFYDASAADYIARFSFIVAVMVMVHSYPVVATRFEKLADYVYRVLIAFLAYSYIQLLCNHGGFWYGDWLPFTVGYLVARQCFSFTKKARPWRFDTTQRLRTMLKERLETYKKKHHSYIGLELLLVIVYLWFYMPCQSLGDACPRCLDDACPRCPDPRSISPSPHWETFSTMALFITTVAFAYQITRSTKLEYRAKRKAEESPSLLFRLGDKRAAEHWPLIFWAFAVALAALQRYYVLRDLNGHMIGSAFYLGVNIHRFGFGRRIGDIPPSDEIPLYRRLMYHSRENLATLFGLQKIQKRSVGSKFISWTPWSMIFSSYVAAFGGISGLSSMECHGLNLIRWSNIVVLTSIPSILFLYKLYRCYSDDPQFTTAQKTVFRYHWYGLLGSTFVYAFWVLNSRLCFNDLVTAGMTVLLWSLVPFPFGQSKSLWQELFDNSTQPVGIPESGFSDSAFSDESGSGDDTSEAGSSKDGASKGKGSINKASENEATKDKVPEEQASKDQNSKGKASEGGSSAAGSASKSSRSANLDNNQTDEGTRTKKATTKDPASASEDVRSEPRGSNTDESPATSSESSEKAPSEKHDMYRRIMTGVNKELGQDDEERALNREKSKQNPNEPTTDKPGSNEDTKSAEKPDGKDGEVKNGEGNKGVGDNIKQNDGEGNDGGKNEVEDIGSGKDDVQEGVNEGSASEAQPDVKTKDKRRKVRGRKRKQKTNSA